jgi:hypothetical protein
MRVRMVPVRSRGVDHLRAIAIPAQAHLVVQFAHMLAISEGVQIRIGRGLPRLPIGTGEDAKEYVVRMGPIGVGSGLHMKAVSMQVRDPRGVLAIYVFLQAPTRSRLTPYDLLHLLGEKCADAAFLRLRDSGTNGRPGELLTDFLGAGRSQIGRIRSRTHLGRLLVEPEHVAHLHAQGSIRPHADSGPGADAIEAKERRGGVSRRGRRPGILVFDHVQFELPGGPVLWSPGPGFLPGLRRCIERIDEIADFGGRRCDRTRRWRGRWRGRLRRGRCRLGHPGRRAPGQGNGDSRCTQLQKFSTLEFSRRVGRDLCHGHSPWIVTGNVTRWCRLCQRSVEGNSGRSELETAHAFQLKRGGGLRTLGTERWPPTAPGPPTEVPGPRRFAHPG